MVYRWAKDNGGDGAVVYGQSVGRRLNVSLGRYATTFQGEVFAVLASVYEIKLQNRSDIYISICSDSQAALTALQAVRTTFPLVQQCQKAVNDISTRYAVGLY
jgi:acetylornithine/succinyldiaminopimelate/putrescine aminotransferase